MTAKAIADAREPSLADFHRMVGAPLDGTVTLTRNGELFEASWPEKLGGDGGWAWAIATARRLISHGWTSGNRRDRDNELRRAGAEYRARCAS